jgi:hypothetical protein
MNSQGLREKLKTAALKSGLNIIKTRLFKTSENCGHLKR